MPRWCWADQQNNFATHDFDSWRDFSGNAPEAEHEMVTTISWKIRVPRVIVLLLFDRLPKKEVKFTRHNVFERDNNTCQYCGKVFERQELNLDHVLPRDKAWPNNVGKRGLLLYPVQYAQRQSPPARGPHAFDPETETAQVAAVCPRYLWQPGARKLAPFCRSRLLERRAERLIRLARSHSSFPRLQLAIALEPLLGHAIRLPNRLGGPRTKPRGGRIRRKSRTRATVPGYTGYTNLRK